VILEEKIEHILEKPLEHSGYTIVRIKISGTEAKVLQLMIERLDGEPITIEDCVAASRQTSALLDVEDPLPHHYTLEVSSAGLDRPLVKPKDYIRFQGHMIKISLKEVHESRKRLVALLEKADDEGILLKYDENGDEKKLNIPYYDISSAKLYIDFNNL
jgi:ribosome maturation factor RimP